MNIIVTGASRGIGHKLVHEFSKNPNHVVIAISRNAEKLELLKEKCFNLYNSTNVIPLVFDISDYSKIKKTLFRIVSKHINSIDILINNAGQLVNKSFKDISETEFDQCYNVNAKSPFFVIQNIMKLFSANAHIVNIGSMGGVQGNVKLSGLSAYSSSKGSLAILTECLAEEFKDKDWRFNCLAIGSAQTEMLEEAFPGYKASFSAKQMAKFIANFALENGRYFNGKVLAVASTTP
jgi:NAD(P)-dependent dehydrogenase (short-subunit alcohol dehydrogenase family)